VEAAGVSDRYGSDHRPTGGLRALVLRWARRPPSRVRVVTASTVSALGIVVVLLLTAGHGVYRFGAEPRPGPTTSLPDGGGRPNNERPGPDVALTVGPERTPSNPPRSTPIATPAATTPRPTGTRAAPPPATPQQARCAVTFARSGSWEQGYVANISLRNLAGGTVNGWTLGWRFGGDQRIRNLWNGRFSQNGRQVQVRDDGWNAAVGPGESVQFGFEVTTAPPSTDPTRFTLNGGPCAQDRP
jgi:hypothetical protein